MAGKMAFKSNNIEVHCADRSGDAVVVSFAPLEYVPEPGWFWGDTFGAKLNVSVIGVVGLQRHWYPGAYADPAVERVRELIGGRRAITYGYSMGAYAALKFSRRLGAAAALAFSPQWSIDPADVGSFDTRYAHHFRRDLNIGCRVEEGEMCDNAFAFYDPHYEPDRLNADYLAKVGVQRVVMPFCWHNTIQYMIETGEAGRMLGTFLNGEGDRRTARRIVRDGRSKSRSYGFGRARMMLVHKMAPGLLRKLVTVEQDPDVAKVYKACAAHIAGQHEQAAELVFQAGGGMSKLDLFDQLELYTGLDFGAATRALGPLFAWKYPNDTFGRLNGVNIMLQQGMNQQCIKELDEISQFTDAPKSFPTFRMFYHLAGKPDGSRHVLLAGMKAGSFALRGIGEWALLAENVHAVGDKAGVRTLLGDLAELAPFNGEELAILDRLPRGLRRRAQLSAAKPAEISEALGVAEDQIDTLTAERADALAQAGTATAELKVMFARIAELEKWVAEGGLWAQRARMADKSLEAEREKAARHEAALRTGGRALAAENARLRKRAEVAAQDLDAERKRASAQARSAAMTVAELSGRLRAAEVLAEEAARRSRIAEQAAADAIAREQAVRQAEQHLLSRKEAPAQEDQGSTEGRVTHLRTYKAAGAFDRNRWGKPPASV